MMAADLAWLRAKWTWLFAVACCFAAVTAGCVRSSARGLANSMVRLTNPAINPDIAILAGVLAVVSTSQQSSTGCPAVVINIQRQFMTTDSDFMVAMHNCLIYQGLTLNLFRLL
jgi:hypothetical protein